METFNGDGWYIHTKTGRFPQVSRNHSGGFAQIPGETIRLCVECCIIMQKSFRIGHISAADGVGEGELFAHPVGREELSDMQIVPQTVVDPVIPCAGGGISGLGFQFGGGSGPE